jgi:PIN domain nuclease of toxin-antitoxin system
MLDDPDNELVFSVASLWEITIKHGLRRPDFQVDPRVFRQELLENGYTELTITSDHAFAVGLLPPIHRDPFDRILIAQAAAEAITLLTSDPIVARYPGPVRAV